MKDDALHELIEQYLEGTLPKKQRLVVESRLATDPAFRAELELQRAMQEHLGDPGAMRLRETLARVMQQPLERPAFRWRLNPGLRLVAVAAAFIMLIIAAWWAMQPASPGKAGQAVAVQPHPDTTDQLAGNPAPPESAPPDPVQPPQTPPLLAQADPTDFFPNPTLDARIGSIRGAGDLEVQIDQPLPDAAFNNQKGTLPLVFRGTMRADSLVMLQPLQLFLYTNRPEAWANKKPRWKTTIIPESAGNDTFQLQLDQTLRLHPGLYYLVLGQQRGSDVREGFRTVWVGRFSFNAPAKTD